jgi:hypothetical protein
MSMIRVSPLEVQVRCDWFDGRPRAVRFARQELPVLAVTRVRRESAAYRVALGPRTCFEVLTETGLFALVYRHRDRRWVVEGLDPMGAAHAATGSALAGLAPAA